MGAGDGGAGDGGGQEMGAGSCYRLLVAHPREQLRLDVSLALLELDRKALLVRAEQVEELQRVRFFLFLHRALHAHRLRFARRNREGGPGAR